MTLQLGLTEPGVNLGAFDVVHHNMLIKRKITGHQLNLRKHLFKCNCLQDQCNNLSHILTNTNVLPQSLRLEFRSQDPV